MIIGGLIVVGVIVFGCSSALRPSQAQPVQTLASFCPSGSNENCIFMGENHARHLIEVADFGSRIHCGDFHARQPPLKEKYVDTGDVRLGILPTR